MDVPLLHVFQFQVALQCEYAMHAAQEIDDAIKANDKGRIFYGVQNFINAVANISKALWGQAGKQSAKRKPLRDSLSVSDASPIRATTARNHYEHFDERLDQWWNGSKKHLYVDLNTAPMEDFVALDPENVFRSLDPKTRDIIFWGDRFDLASILAEIQRIHPLATAGYQSFPPIRSAP